MMEEKIKEVFLKNIKKFKKNPWMVFTVVLGIIVIVLLIFVLKVGFSEINISEKGASQKLVTYLNEKVGGGVNFVSSEDIGNLYRVVVSYRGNNFPVYVTKDGGYFVQGVVPITAQATQITHQEQQPSNIQKSDKPKVELFVMTHCPYGTQAEKGLIPVLELLKDKIDAKIRFVHYFMHGDKEEEETYRQICIREEQPDKYLSYLKCFLEDGNSNKCLVKEKIDRTKLNSCIKSKSKDYYASDSELSKSYGVRGSPTLIINGAEVRSGRAPASFLSTICSAFNKPVEECNKELSSATPNPGFGYSTSSGSSGGSCN